MKKKIALVLVCAVVLSLFPMQTLAADISFEQTQGVIAALNILSGDENGNLNLQKNVTRAEFTKMLTQASAFRDSVSPVANASPFKDVPYSHWAASYIKTAVDQKWVTGYLDGSFRPNNNITLEEAANTVLKLLGYTAADFSGAYPQAQLSLYESLGLNKNIRAMQGSVITREECVNLFYNVLNTKTKGKDSVYITTLGYSVGSDGKVDYTKIINETMEGPFVTKESLRELSLPFALDTATVYLNGATVSPSSVGKNIAVYYSKSLRTIWAYENHVTGVYEKALPNNDYPTSVVLSGVTYDVASSDAVFSLSTAGALNIGNSVTLILGKDQKVVLAVSATEGLSSTTYGIVTGTGTKTYQNANGTTYQSDYVTVFTTNASTFEYQTTGTFSAGNLVRIAVRNAETTVSRLGTASASGKFDAQAKTFAGFKLADNVRIIETNETNSVRIFESRLDGLTISSEKVLFYAQNSSGKITDLILKNVTGDAEIYGVIAVTAADKDGNSIYTYDIQGKKESFTGAELASTGAVRFIYRSGKFYSTAALLQIPTVSNITAAYIEGSDGKVYLVSDKAAVYIQKDGTYQYSSVSEVMQGDYHFRAYYDKETNAGGRVRVIVAVSKV